MATLTQWKALLMNLMRPSRACSAEVPMPYAKHSEDAALPQPDKIVKAVQQMF